METELLNLTSEPEVQAATGVDRVSLDSESLREFECAGKWAQRHGCRDRYGIDGTHPDLAGRVVENVKLLDTLR
jgi:hypothetical protein